MTVVEDRFNFDPETDDLTNVLRNRRSVEVLESVETGSDSIDEISFNTGYSRSSVRRYLDGHDEAGLLENDWSDDGNKQVKMTEFGSKVYSKFIQYEEEISGLKDEVDEIFDVFEDSGIKQASKSLENLDYIDLASNIYDELLEERDYRINLEYIDSLEWVSEAEDAREVAVDVLHELKNGKADIPREIGNTWSTVQGIKQEINQDYEVAPKVKRLKEKGLLRQIKDQNVEVKLTDEGRSLINNEEIKTGENPILNTDKRVNVFKQLVFKSGKDEVADSLGESLDSVRGVIDYLQEEGLVETKFSQDKIYSINDNFLDPALNLLNWYEKESAYKNEVRTSKEDISTFLGPIWTEESFNEISQMVERLSKGEEFEEVESDLTTTRKTSLRRLSYFLETGALGYQGGGDFIDCERTEELLNSLENFVESSDNSDLDKLLRWGGSEEKIELMLSIDGESDYRDVASQIDVKKSWVEKYGLKFERENLIEREKPGTDQNEFQYTEKGLDYISFLKNLSEVLEDTAPINSQDSISELRQFGSSGFNGSNSDTSTSGSNIKTDGEGIDYLWWNEAKKVLNKIKKDGIVPFHFLEVKIDGGWEKTDEMVDELRSRNWIKEKDKGKYSLTNEAEEFFEVF